MALYRYKAINKLGNSVEGEIEAESAKLARSKLIEDGIYVIQIQESSKKSVKFSLFSRISSNDILIFTRQMSVLSKSNIPLVEALGIILKQLENEKLKVVISKIKDQVTAGKSLAGALSEYPKIFPKVYVNMIAAGEVSGNLALVLERLTEHLSKTQVLKNKVLGAMVYPVIIGLFSLLVITFMMVYIVPRIVEMLADFGQTLPLPTKILIGISNFIISYGWLVVLLIVFMVIIYNRYTKTKVGRYNIDSFKLKLPVFGDLIKKIAVVRFTSTLSTLLSGGVTLLLGLEIVKNVVKNAKIEKLLSEAKRKVSEGMSLSRALSAKIMPQFVLNMINVGEKTGELETMLSHVSKAYDREVDLVLSTMTSLVGLIMILFLGGVVLFIAISIIIPLMKIYKFE